MSDKPVRRTLRQDHMEVSAHTSVSPPITSLVLDLYNIAGLELQRIRTRQALRREPMSIAEVQSLKYLTDIIRHAQAAERDAERDSRLRELTDEQLEARLSEIADVFARR